MFRRLLGAQPSLLTVEPSSVSVEGGSTFQLTATVYDQNGNVVAGATVSWASDDTGVATVDASGLVTGVDTGICTITATYGALSDTCTVTVNQVDPHFANVLFLLDGTQPGILA